MKRRKYRLAVALMIAGAGVLAVGCGTAKVERQQHVGTQPTTQPAIVYVADFELDASDIRSEPGLLAPPPKLPGPLGQLSPAPPGASKDPRELARDVVDAMNQALVEELNQAGFTARRLPKSAAPPSSGWLIRGVFTEVNQGDRLRRAAIGFGQGKTELRVMVDLHDLSQGTPKPFYELATTADSGKGPGSAAMVMRFPAAIAVRFVLAGKDLDRNVKQTAVRIAEEIGRQAKATG